MTKKEREHCAEKYKITRDKEAMKITWTPYWRIESTAKSDIIYDTK
jgi:hypothetical protein